MSFTFFLALNNKLMEYTFMVSQKAFLYQPGILSDLGEYIIKFFSAGSAANAEELVAALEDRPYSVVVMDVASEAILDLDACKEVLELEAVQDTSFIVLTESITLEDKLKAYEMGCDDILVATVGGDEACARITKSIFHRIATNQLSKRLDLANSASQASEGGDPEANLQFLLAVHECDNLDQLGQQLFSVIERYKLKCSLQIRSIIGDKNMEAHGMAKDLETQLLSQLADSSRFIDFGNCTILNFDKVSVLIKNMPADEPEKYTAIKDNTCLLVQGLNTRVHALEDQFRIQQERDAMTKLSQDVNAVMDSLRESYEEVRIEIVSVIERTSAVIQDRVCDLSLAEADKVYLEKAANECVREAGRIFNQTLVVDDLEKLESAVSRTLKSVDLPPAHTIAKYKGGGADSPRDLL